MTQQQPVMTLQKNSGKTRLTDKMEILAIFIRGISKIN
jgi:hypothetical protein